MTTPTTANVIFQTWFAAVVELTTNNGSYIAFADATINAFEKAQEAGLDLPLYDGDHQKSFKAALDNLRAAATSLMQPHRNSRQIEQQTDRLLFAKWDMFEDPVTITGLLTADLLDVFAKNKNVEREAAINLYQTIQKATESRKNLVLG